MPTAIGILGTTFPPGKAKNYAFSCYGMYTRVMLPKGVKASLTRSSHQPPVLPWAPCLAT